MDFDRLSADYKNSLATATNKYHEALAGGPAISYLEARGITAEVASTFRLGYVSEPEVGHEASKGRLAIPFLSPTGVVDLRFRAIDDVQPKYLGTGGSRTHLFNVRDLHTGSRYVAICEGELDTVVMSGLVGVPALGITGVSNWKSHYKHCFADFDRVFIVMDGDEPGRNAARKLRGELSNSVIVDLQEGDVNECFLGKGADYIKERLGL